MLPTCSAAGWETEGARRGSRLQDAIHKEVRLVWPLPEATLGTFQKGPTVGRKKFARLLFRREGVCCIALCPHPHCLPKAGHRCLETMDERLGLGPGPPQGHRVLCEGTEHAMFGFVFEILNIQLRWQHS